MTTPAATPPATATPASAINLAVKDPDLLERLRRHALARLSLWLRDRPHAVRHELAQDILQETVQRALAHQAEFDGSNGSTPIAWLHGILNNVLAEYCRKFRRLPQQPPVEPEHWENLAAALDTADESPSLHSLLEQLPEAERNLVIWHHLQGLSHQEIASRLGISVAAARTRLCRAMAKLAARAQAAEGRS